MPASTHPTCSNESSPTALRVDEDAAARAGAGRSTTSGIDATGATQVSAGPSVATQSSRSRVANAARRSARIASCAVVVGLVRDPLLAPERAAEVGPEPGLDRGDRRPAAVPALVHVVARVAAGEQAVAGAGYLAGREVLVDRERHQRDDTVGDRRRRGTHPRRSRRAAPARRGSPSPRACRRPRRRRSSRRAARARRSRRGPVQSR